MDTLNGKNKINNILKRFISIFRNPIATFFTGAILSLVLTLIFHEPLSHFLSKAPFFRYIDKNEPKIDVVKPNIDQSLNMDTGIRNFVVSFSEKDSGLSFSKSYLKISRKDNKGYESLNGNLELNENNSELSFTLDKELKHGEYLFEVLLVDRANNQKGFRKEFMVEEKEPLNFSIEYENYEESSQKEIFADFHEEKKEFLKDNNLYIYRINFYNKDPIAVLKDLYLSIDISGGVFYYWYEISNFQTEGVKVINLSESMNKQLAESEMRVFLSQQFLNIKQMGPNGFLGFIILVGEFKSFAKEHKTWKGIDIYGGYISEGYGNPQTQKVEYHWSLIEK